MNKIDSVDVLAAFNEANPHAMPMLSSETHTCTHKCQLWEHRKCKAFVCRAHRKVHFCGERCDRKITTNADVVCSLTGLVLSAAPHVYQPVYSKSCRPVKQSHQFRRPGPSSQVLRMQRMSAWIHNALHSILCSQKRVEISKTHRTRAVRAAARALKTRGTFNAVHTAAALVCIRAGNTLQPPANPNDYELKVYTNNSVNIL